MHFGGRNQQIRLLQRKKSHSKGGSSYYDHTHCASTGAGAAAAKALRKGSAQRKSTLQIRKRSGMRKTEFLHLQLGRKSMAVLRWNRRCDNEETGDTGQR